MRTVPTGRTVAVTVRGQSDLGRLAKLAPMLELAAKLLVLVLLLAWAARHRWMKNERAN